MKNTFINNFYVILIFILFFAILFVPNQIAQTRQDKIEQTNEEKEKLEVQKLVDSFTNALEETKDLNRIPKTFFANEFKEYFARNTDWKDASPPKLLSQLSKAETYEAKIMGLNVSYLLVMTANGICCENYWDADFFPPEILEVIKKSKFLAEMFLNTESDDDGFQIPNMQDYQVLNADTKMLVDAQRNYLASRSETWNINFKKNIIETRKTFVSFNSYLCSRDNECGNLPKDTRFIDIAAFPYILRIIKVKNDYKILDIFPYNR